MTRPPSARIEHPNLVAFYGTARCRPDDLYASERRFLPWLAARAESVLDAGCASGGFADIWHHYAPNVRYTGVDASGELIAAGARQRPTLRLIHGDVADRLPLPDHYATVVQALGWLHQETRHSIALEELWRLSERYLFFDLRLTPSYAQQRAGRQWIANEGERTSVPYITVPWPEAARQLLALNPARILGFGYWGEPAHTVTGVEDQVCFAAFVLERAVDGEVADPRICVDLPLQWPPELASAVTVLPAADLDALVPRETRA